jgi:hypothetical protein
MARCFTGLFTTLAKSALLFSTYLGGSANDFGLRIRTREVGSGGPQIYLTDVVDRGDRLVATGWGMLTEDGNGDHPVVVIWTSRDGRSWTDVPA